MPRYCFRTLLLVVALAAVVAGGYWAWKSAVGPRVLDSEVQRQIEESLPAGTPKSDVLRWIDGRFEHPSEYHDFYGGSVIQCWITDSGPRASLIPDDIRIRLVFDANDRFLFATARTEPRF